MRFASENYIFNSAGIDKIVEYRKETLDIRSQKYLYCNKI